MFPGCEQYGQHDHLLRVVGLIVAELRLLLQDLVHLGGVRGSAVAAVGGRRGAGHGQNGGDHKLKSATGLG